MSVVSLLLLTLLAVTMETVSCQASTVMAWSRQRLTEAVLNLTARLEDLEGMEQLGEILGDKMNQTILNLGTTLGEQMTKAVEKIGEKQNALGDKLTEGIQNLGEKMSETLEKVRENQTAGMNALGDKLAEGMQKLGEQMAGAIGQIGDKMGKINEGFDKIGEILVARDNVCPVVPQPVPTSCADVKEYHSRNTVYTLTVNDKNIRVVCDQTTAGGGWTVIQRRRDGSVSFNRNWTEYEEGFGDLNGEFWLGLSNIYRMTSSDRYSLRVDLEDFDNNTAFALYDTFYIDGPDQNYRLHLANYSGTAGDSLTMPVLRSHVHNNMFFSTPDRDHDGNPVGSCAAKYKFGWWFNYCYQASVNAPYKKPGSDLGIVWFTMHNDWTPCKKAEMKIKPRN